MVSGMGKRVRGPGAGRLFLVALLALGGLLLLPGAKGVLASSEATALENIPPDQVESVLAGLSDEQVRGILIAGLRKQAVAQESGRPGDSAGLLTLVAGWLHLIDGDSSRSAGSRAREIFGHVGSIPAEIREIVRSIGSDGTMLSAWQNIGLVLLVFLVALGMEFIFRVMTAGFWRRFLSEAVPDLKGLLRFWAGIMHVLPPLINLFVLSAASLLLFIVTPAANQPQARLLFMAVLFVMFFLRATSLAATLIFAPREPSLRLLAMGDVAAGRLHRLAVMFLYFVGVGTTLIALARELGASGEFVILLALFLGTVLLLMIGRQVVLNRQLVADHILATDSGETGKGWIVRQFAALWHLLVLIYLFVVWVIFFVQQTSVIRQDRGAFLLSILAVPIFLVLDRVAQWVVRTTVRTLNIYSAAGSEAGDTGTVGEVIPVEERERQLIARVGSIVRLAVLGAVVVWVLNLWGYSLPYAAAVTRAVFESLVTLALALLVWRIVAGYIERKIREMIPEEEEEEGQDDEWGAAAQRGRGYTLLPMIRKFIATVLVVMVTLIILSAIGVDIAPLLAGAGVVGIALGFGAQKLVSDVLSGFFFLLDDAFRVGEYLQAGNVSGAVEAITLRNVMLRHHRGMLQIVPYSELGPITNFMRGGIVVKFNLEFPYDTDIDKVRKIIQRVGLAMLQDPEFGDDFIKPVKSQGVREITGSVMVIRVKFTAKPGTHFVIRREAYRRITEALAARGIHYAHRKVIVELPKDDNGHPDSQKVAEAGAAAALAEDDARKADSGGPAPPGPAMPGM